MRHVPPPAVRGGLTPRIASLFVGLAICALGIVLILQADLGLAPWDVLHQGIANHTPLSFGVANVAVGVVVLFSAWLLGARVGFGTIANATCVGAFVEALTATHALPDLAGGALPGRIAFLALGILAFGIGTALYIGADAGAGPRDSLMLVVALRAHTRIGLARAATELAALGIGFALGGDVGVGTVAFAIFIGPSVELAFLALRHSPLARPQALLQPAPAQKEPTVSGSRVP